MNRRDVLFLLIVSMLFSSSTVLAQTSATGVLVPIGGGMAGDLLPGNGSQPAASVTRAQYIRIFKGLIPEGSARTVEGAVKVLVLPMALSPNPESITSIQKTDVLRVTESRFFQLKEACQQAMPVGISCEATLAPLYVRTDALDPVMLDYFAQEWSVVFILSGDPTTALRVIRGTPVEAALEMLYKQGVIISGTGGGASILGKALISGYQGNDENTTLVRGETTVWNDPLQHGLLFGVQDALLETQFYQLGRMGGLLQAISSPKGPHLGIGVDAYTGVHISSGRTLENVFGPYNITVLDAETYEAAANAFYRDCSAGSACLPVLSIRNVLVHLLAPGHYSYDLLSRQHSLGAPEAVPDRSYESLALPQGAGPLILAGDLSEKLEGNQILDHFADLCGGEDGRVLVITAGFPSDSSTERMANWIATELKGMPVKLMLLKNATAMPSFPKYYTGIVFAHGNQSKIKPELLVPIKEAWLAGIPLLADDGAASALGAYFSSHGPTPNEGKPAEAATQASFLNGETQIRAGLGLLDINIEPQILEDNRWGRLFSLAYNHPSQLAVGITQDTALEIDKQGARVIGSSVVIVLDFKTAKLGVGDNRSFVVANGLLDVFVGGENLLETETETVIGENDTLTPNADTPTVPENHAAAAYDDQNPLASNASSTGIEIQNKWTGVGAFVLVVVLALFFGFWRARRHQPRQG